MKSIRYFSFARLVYGLKALSISKMAMGLQMFN